MARLDPASPLGRGQGQRQTVVGQWSNSVTEKAPQYHQNEITNEHTTRPHAG